MRIFILLGFALSLLLGGCATVLDDHTGVKQNGSVVDYLYPNSKESPSLRPGLTTLHPPVRVGIAFVPVDAGTAALSENDRTQLLERVKASFTGYAYIDSIQIVPSQYLREKGGFENLEQAARLFNVDLMALVSYDQVQFNDTSRLSLLYWSIVGAYVIKGNRYDVHTMVDCAVFDVHSHQLLFRAPGTSQVKGSATLVGFGEEARNGRRAGFDQAVADLLPRLHTELDTFRERVRTDAHYQIEPQAGRGGGAFDLWELLLALGLVAVTKRTRAR